MGQRQQVVYQTPHALEGPVDGLEMLVLDLVAGQLQAARRHVERISKVVGHHADEAFGPLVLPLQGVLSLP